MSRQPAEVHALVLEQVIGTAAAPDRPGASPLARGLIVELLPSGEIEVVVPPDADTRLRCDFLETAANGSLQLAAGDLVLVMLPQAVGQSGCVLGRVGRYRAPATPDRVTIEAAEALTLKCGDSSVEMRQDGKVLIRGNDVVARGENSTKIKGGTVAIN